MRDALVDGSSTVQKALNGSDIKTVSGDNVRTPHIPLLLCETDDDVSRKRVKATRRPKSSRAKKNASHGMPTPETCPPPFPAGIYNKS